MNCPRDGIERILPLVGFGMKNPILIISNVRDERLFYSAVRGVVDMNNFEPEFMGHVNSCDGCRKAYDKYQLENC